MLVEGRSERFIVRIFCCYGEHRFHVCRCF